MRDWKPEKTMDQVTGGNESCKRKNKRMVVLQNKISKQSVAALPKVNFEGRIFVVNTEAEARKAISYLNTHSIVGVDTETRPSFKKGTTHKVALLQISTHDTCFLFRLNRLGLPDFLEEFLQMMS